MRKISEKNLTNFTGGEVTCEDTAGVLYGTGIVMMMIPGVQVFGFGLAAMSMIYAKNC
ncbi:hypothetical protein LB456_05470 [Psychroflexus sp. CAK57W]|uniref:hypothetical protein n=1 Tax=Psychroflexus curvus TaxID=2873595 RepID=UPI001CCB9072|nr:hypothetical protein [Psychroflexus curvus]MBZ9786902.1 hypothetical protein [Psychroflexus curvus]